MKLIRNRVSVEVIDHEATGIQIRTCRRRYGISASQLSGRAGISKSYLMMLECGDRSWSEGIFEEVLLALRELTGKKNP